MEYTGVAIVNAKQELLVMWSKNWKMWNIPGGKIEACEDSCRAAKRELFEETGLSVMDCNKVTDEVKDVDGSVCRLVLYEAHKWFGTPQVKEPDKHDSMRFVPMQDLAAYPRKSILLERALEKINV